MDSSTQFYNTIEREDLLAAAYADKYREFMEGKEAKKSGKSKGNDKYQAHQPHHSGHVWEAWVMANKWFCIA